MTAPIDYEYAEPDAQTILIRGMPACSTCGVGTTDKPCRDHQPTEYAEVAANA
jgi:hypothetical protein